MVYLQTYLSFDLSNSGSDRGPFGIRADPFGLRSGSVRGPRGVRSGSVRATFEGRAGFARTPFGVRKPPQPKKNCSPGGVEGEAVAPPSQQCRLGFRNR